jgi:hypothetical protein
MVIVEHSKCCGLSHQPQRLKIQDLTLKFSIFNFKKLNIRMLSGIETNATVNVNKTTITVIEEFMNHYLIEDS